MKILIVEDDKLLGKALAKAFAESEIEVYWKENGKEALDYMEEHNFDLICLDIAMPIMDGYTTLKKIKANPKTSHIPVIMLSNFGQLDEIEKALNLGASDYMIKANVDIDELVNKIKDKIES